MEYLRITGKLIRIGLNHLPKNNVLGFRISTIALILTITVSLNSTKFLILL